MRKKFSPEWGKRRQMTSGFHGVAWILKLVEQGKMTGNFGIQQCVCFVFRDTIQHLKSDNQGCFIYNIFSNANIASLQKRWRPLEGKSYHLEEGPYHPGRGEIRLPRIEWFSNEEDGSQGKKSTCHRRRTFPRKIQTRGFFVVTHLRCFGCFLMVL